MSHYDIYPSSQQPEQPEQVTRQVAVCYGQGFVRYDARQLTGYGATLSLEGTLAEAGSPTPDNPFAYQAIYFRTRTGGAYLINTEDRTIIGLGESVQAGRVVKRTLLGSFPVPGYIQEDGSTSDRIERTDENVVCGTRFHFVANEPERADSEMIGSTSGVEEIVAVGKQRAGVLNEALYGSSMDPVTKWIFTFNSTLLQLERDAPSAGPLPATSQ